MAKTMCWPVMLVVAGLLVCGRSAGAQTARPGSDQVDPVQITPGPARSVTPVASQAGTQPVKQTALALQAQKLVGNGYGAAGPRGENKQRHPVVRGAAGGAGHRAICAPDEEERCREVGLCGRGAVRVGLRPPGGGGGLVPIAEGSRPAGRRQTLTAPGYVTFDWRGNR